MIHIPGNVLAGNWKLAIVIDDQATSEQEVAILNAFGGKLGGPLADVAQLVGKLFPSSAPISFDVTEGRGHVRVGSVVEADMEPYRSASGAVTTLNETVFHHSRCAGLGEQGLNVSEKR